MMASAPAAPDANVVAGPAMAAFPAVAEAVIVPEAVAVCPKIIVEPSSAVRVRPVLASLSASGNTRLG